MLSTADAERLRTWAIEIATTLLPNAPQRDDGHDRRFGDAGGLVIDKQRGCWWSYGVGRGGWSAVDLIAHIKGRDRPISDDETWAKAWLEVHPGTGSCNGDTITDDEDPGEGAASRSTAYRAQEIIDQIVPPDGTTGETYLASRQLPGPYPADVGFVQYARTGESAVVGLLRSHNRVVGVHLEYIDGYGNASLVEPKKQRFMVEKAPDAVLEVYPAPAAPVKDLHYDLLICEGLADGLSVLQLQRPCRVIALPGIWALRHVQVKKGERILVVRDGDEPGSPADKALTAGIDSLILQGATVTVTRTPQRCCADDPKIDANVILQKAGIKGLSALIADVEECALSEDGELQRLCRLDKLQYDQERKTVAGKLGIRVSTLDGMVAKKRNGDADEHRKQADVLVDIAEAAKLFRTADQVAFADIDIGGHRETWPIRSTGFSLWLRHRFFEKTKSAPNSEAVQAALGTIEAKARYEATERQVFLRVAGAGDRIYIDLADPDWRAIEVDATGWRIVTESPVRFRRTRGMLPLPLPTRGGKVEALRKFVNLPNDHDFVLMIAWIQAALRPNGPYPVLALAGEQGGAKSTLCAVLRRLVDHNSAPLRALPREDRDLFIAATNGHVLSFDNLSGLPAWISDTLCRLSTGGGFAVRALYTDQDEILFDAMRPIILNGIEDFVTRPDLADRAVPLTLQAIPGEKRRDERQFWEEFEAVHPEILGALLDTVSTGLRHLPTTKLPILPRMADFALWATACEGACWESGTFWGAYCSNLDEAIETVLEADVATAVRGFMAKRIEPTWEGSATDLQMLLAREVTEGTLRERTWPKTPKGLSGRLRRAATFLRKVGINVEFAREGHSRDRKIRISLLPERVGKNASAPSDASANPETPYNINEIDADASSEASDVDASADTRDASADAHDPSAMSRPNPLQSNEGSNSADASDGADAFFPYYSNGCAEQKTDVEDYADRPLRRRPSVRTTARIHEAHKADPELPISDLAKKLKLPKRAVQHALNGGPNG